MENPFTKLYPTHSLVENSDRLYDRIKRIILKADMIGINKDEMYNALSEALRKTIEPWVMSNMKLQNAVGNPVTLFYYGNHKLSEYYTGNNRADLLKDKYTLRETKGNSTIDGLACLRFQFINVNVDKVGNARELVNILDIKNVKSLLDSMYISIIVPTSVKYLDDLDFLIKYYTEIHTNTQVTNNYKAYAIELTGELGSADKMVGNFFNNYVSYFWKYNKAEIDKQLKKVTGSVGHQDNIDDIKIELNITKRK